MKYKSWLAVLLTLALLAMPVAPRAALSEEALAPRESLTSDVFPQGEEAPVESAPIEAPVEEIQLELGAEDEIREAEGANAELGEAIPDAEGLTLAAGGGDGASPEEALPEDAFEANAAINDAPESASNATGTAIDAVHFPDAAFRACVASECDLNGDGVLSAAEAAQVTEMNVWDTDIRSLTGIEYLPALESLDCGSNSLGALDLRHNTALRELDCSENYIRDLNLRYNTALEHLNCRDNELTELDLSKNTQLKSLWCSDNRIFQLDFTQQPILVKVLRDYGPVRRSPGNIYFIHPDAHDDVDGPLSFDSGITITANGKKIYTPNQDIIRDIGTVTIGTGEIIEGLQTAKSFWPQWISWLHEYSLTSSTANAKIAKVNASGQVMGVKAGSAKITVLAKNGLGIRYTLKVVKAPSKVTVSAKSLTLGVNEKKSLKVTLPSGSASHDLTWVSSNEDVAYYYDYSDAIYGESVGTATITVYTYNGKSASCKVTVLPEPESISLPAALSLGAGQSYSLKPALSPSGAGGSIEYESSNAAVVSVDKNGKLTARKAGTATIEASTYNGCSAEVTVTVSAAPSKVTLNAKKATLGVGERFQLAASVPAGSFSGFTFKSGSPKVASVSADGLVTANRAGTAKITVSAYNGKKATFTATVKKKPTSIRLDAATVTLAPGQVYSPKVTLSKGAGGTITWSSSDESVLSAADGKITAVSVGTAVLTATTYNGLSASCAVTVKRAPTAVALAESSVKLAVGMKYPLDWSVTRPVEDGQADPVSFSSRSAKIATVSAEGVVTAKKVGSTKVTVKTWNGLTATCTVKVVAAPKKIALPGALTLVTGDDYSLKPTLTPSSAMAALTWSSSNERVATVDEAGLIRALAGGAATITAVTQNGKKASCKLTVLAWSDGEAQATDSRAANLAAASETDQIVLVEYTGGSNALLSVHEKVEGQWRQLIETPAYVGKNGIDKTREGDKKTPTGTFNLTTPFGILDDPGAAQPYTKVTKYHYWCGRSSSPYYNQLVDSRVTGQSCTSSDEHLIDYKGTYNYCLFIDYNASGVPHKGSCIFLHCFSKNKYTGGCVAISESVMRRIVRWARAGAKIVIQ